MKLVVPAHSCATNFVLVWFGRYWIILHTCFGFILIGRAACLYKDFLITFGTTYVHHFRLKLLPIENSFVKSIRSISQKSQFYRRAVSRFLYTMCNQPVWHVLFTLLGLGVENITFIVKLAYLGIYFIQKYARRLLIWLTVLLILQHINLFFQLQDWMLQKLLIISTNASSESFPEVNFRQKTQWEHTIPPTPRGELWDAKQLPCIGMEK